MRINKTHLILVAVGIIAALAIAAVIANYLSTSANRKEQELSRRADEILADRKVTAIKDLKHLWELAPFIGKSIQLYGKMVFNPHVKGSQSRFAINGDLDLWIDVGFDIELAKKYGMRLVPSGNLLISDFCIINANLGLYFLDENIPESYDELHSASFARHGEYPVLLWIEPIKVFKSQPQAKDRPDSVSISACSSGAAAEMKFLFSGLCDDADWISFARYVSILEKQKEMFTQTDNSMKKQTETLVGTSAGLQLAKVEYMADLISFVGTTVEMKGRIVENCKRGAKYWIVLNEEKNIAIPLPGFFGPKTGIGKIVTIYGYLAFSYLNPNKRAVDFPPEGRLFMSSNFVQLLSKEEINDSLRPCVSQIPDIMTKERKAFITGYYGDADVRALKNFIINMMKEDAAEKNNPHRSR